MHIAISDKLFFGGPTGTRLLNFSRHKFVSFLCALKNPSVTAKKHSPNVFLNAAVRIPHIILREIKKAALTRSTTFLFGAPRLTSVEHLCKKSKKPYGIRVYCHEITIPLSTRLVSIAVSNMCNDTLVNTMNYRK